MQGGVISPVLGNIFLHHVLDEWFEREGQPRLKGRSFLTRFADDFVIGCELEADAQKVMGVLPKRFARFGLRIHPTKTTLVVFGKPKASQPSAHGNGTVEFLGFTHYWERTRRGGYAVGRKTKGSKYHAALTRIGEWCKENRHQPIAQQHHDLSRQLLGHYAYYGVSGNSRALGGFWHAVKQLWHYWLRRRSRAAQEGARLWDLLETRFRLPRARIVHKTIDPQLTWSLST